MELKKPTDCREVGSAFALTGDRLLSTIDGVVWAKEFCRVTGFTDEAWALAWFCNAIMAGFDEATRRASLESESYQALTALIRDEALPGGEYVHYVTCSGDRHAPVGGDGCSCPLGRRIKTLVAARSALPPLQLQTLLASLATQPHEPPCLRCYRETEPCACWIGRMTEFIEAHLSGVDVQPAASRRCFKCGAPATHVCRYPNGRTLADSYFCAPCSQKHEAMDACIGTLEPLAALSRAPEPDLDLIAALKRIAGMKKCRAPQPVKAVGGRPVLSPAAAQSIHEFGCPYCTARSAVRAARAGAEAPRRCTWDEDEDGVWRTSCDEAWFFEGEGAPSEHNARFCFYCGLPITANTYAARVSPPEAPQ